WVPPESSVTPPAVVTLDVFARPDWNGAYPQAAMVVGPDGALYGSTSSGGSGTLFRLSTDGAFTKLTNFQEGANPETALVVGPDGALYGVAPSGGRNWGSGAGFRLQSNGNCTSGHSFNYADR